MKETRLTPKFAGECVYAEIVMGVPVAKALYADYLLTASKGMQAMKNEETELSSKFNVKNFMETRMNVGFKIRRDWIKTLLYLTQTAYTHKLLLKNKMLISMPIDTPTDLG